MGEAVRIASVAAGGDGVARLGDGRVAFVPRAAPGDVVELRLVQRKRTFARAEIERIVEPSPDRVAPPCPHYDGDACGGCALQHLAYPAQVAAKAAFVRDALLRIAKADVPAFDVVANPRPFGWRTRLALSVDARTGAIGLLPRDRPDAPFDLVDCLLATDAVRRLWGAVRERRDLLPPTTGRVTLREDRGGGLHVVVQGPSEWPRAAALDAGLATVGPRATLWLAPEGGVARVVAGPEPSRAATVFEQVDPSMGDVVRRHAIAALGDVAGRHVWDLYAGIGETTDALAAAGATVESVEADPDAVAAATAKRPGVARRVGRVEELLPRLRAPDLVVANPPRAGLGPDVVDGLLARTAARIVYVSCDPATLARDVARLAPRWRVEALRAFDSFPQTAHVETVAVLTAS